MGSIVNIRYYAILIKWGVELLILGVLFFILGVIAILEQKYTINKINGKRYLEEKNIDNKTYLNRYKSLLGIFSIILGVFCILNYIIY